MLDMHVSVLKKYKTIKNKSKITTLKVLVVKKVKEIII